MFASCGGCLFVVADVSLEEAGEFGGFEIGKNKSQINIFPLCEFLFRTIQNKTSFSLISANNH